MFVAKQTNNEENADVVVYKKLIEGFSQQLSHAKPMELRQSLQQIAANYHVDVTLEDSGNIALPMTLASQLTDRGGLLLATEQQAYLLKRIPLHNNYLLKLHLPPSPVENNTSNMMLTAVLYIGVCAILLLWLFPLAKRLYVLTNAASSIGKGESNIRVPLNKFSYIYPLEKSFNHMATQIEKLMADNKLLARSLSHDIRTPMSCLRFGIEAAMDCPNIEKKDEYLTRMEAELTQMEDMTSAFLSYAGMERQGINLQFESIELNQFIIDVCADFQSLAEQYNINLTCQTVDQVITYQIDGHWFHRALQNLISNALQYATKNVVIAINHSSKAISLSVTDDGKGIDEKKLDAVFDPFVKLDADRSREQGHFGLGLAICQKVVHWHHGEITASNQKNTDGACFNIKLPL